MEESDRPSKIVPSKIVRKHLVARNSFSLSQSGKYTLHAVDFESVSSVASQMWLLGRLLPFLIGKYIPTNDKYWGKLHLIATHCINSFEPSCIQG